MRWTSHGASSPSTRPRTAARARARRGLSALVALATAGTSLALTAAPAAAVPVYEIDARWAPGTPTVVASGDVVNAEWRVNVNDSAAAPSNEPVDNMTVELTLDNGLFRTLPDSCLTTGVDPVSAIGGGGTTLTCNLGTQPQGSAHVLQTGIEADGSTGDQIVASGAIDGHSDQVTPILIDNPFAMDVAWQSPTNNIGWADDYVDLDLQWTLFLQEGSDPGPSTVSYTLNASAANGAPVVLRPGTACTPFTEGAAVGHPWSGGDHPATHMSPFVGQCTLTPTGTPGQFTMTLTGIDYSQTQVPTRDSAGRALPADRAAIASGSVWLRVQSGESSSLTLTSSAPTYSAPNGDTSADDPANNESNKTWTRGGWANAWQPEATGDTAPSWWSDEFRVSPGSDVQSVVSATWGLGNAAPDAQYGHCVILDTAYVTYEFSRLVYGWNAVSGPLVEPATIAYYTGDHPAVTPGSGGYDPNAFTCVTDPAGWTTTEPADPSTIKAVRGTYPFSAVDGAEMVTLNVRQTIKPGTPVGTDVWQFGEALVNGTWQRPSRSMDPADRGAGPATPDARYPFIGSGRDVVRIIGVTPAVSKAVDRTTVKPGIPATYTLTYSANGTGAVDPTVDGYRIVDTLPPGVTYVDGSASPEPAVSTADGRQVLSWTLDDVPTNAAQTLTYQAVAAPSVVPGSRLVNSAVASVGGQTSPQATASVTVTTNGLTLVGKSTDQWYISNADGSGDGEGSWTVTLRSEDPLPQAFTDTIDILPYNGDGRGTDYEGTYAVTAVDAPAGATVYYTDADRDALSDDPADRSNGNAPGDPSGSSVGWTTTPIDNPTAIRVIGGELPAGGTFRFTITIATDGADPGDVWVNRAQARAEHTELVMRTSEPLTMGTYYSASLKKYVQDRDGEWHDAQDPSDYPVFRIGDTVPYRIVVTNTGQGALTNVRVSDDQAPELGSFVVESLEPGASEAHEFEVTLDETFGTSLVNTASATVDPPEDADGAPVINPDPAGIDIANYTTVKTSEPEPGSAVAPGQTVTYTVEVTQEGSAPADAELVDDLSDVLDDAVLDEDSITASIGDATLVDGLLVWSGTVPVGETATITYAVTVKDAEALEVDGDFDLLNVVTSDGCVPADGELPDCTTNHLVGWYEYSKTSDPASGSTVSPGQTVTYTVEVVQRGKAEVPSARVTDDLAQVLDDTTYNGDAAATAGVVVVDGPTLSWTGDLAVDETVTITYSVEVLPEGDHTLTNAVTAPDDGRSRCVPAPDENPDCTTTHPKGWYEFSKTSDPVPGSSVEEGDTVTYTVTVDQRGAAEIPGASISDDLSQVLDDATYAEDAEATAGEVVVDGASLTWTGDLAVGDQVIITYSVTVVADGDDRLVNVVTAPDDGRSTCVPAADENPDCTTTHYKGSYVYSKTSDPESGSRVRVGDKVTYTVTVAQVGEGSVADVRITDDLSRVLDDARYDGDAKATAGTVEVTGDELTWTGDLAVGDEVTLTYSVTVLEAGDDEMVNVVTAPEGSGGVCVPAADGNADCTTTHDKAAAPATGGGLGLLPRTGAGLVGLAAAAALLVLLGSAAVLMVRRRATA